MDIRLKRYQKDFDHSYSFGVFATLELLARRPRQVMQVLLSSKADQNAGAARLREQCAALRIPVEVNDKAIQRLDSKDNAYAVGVFRKYTDTLDAASSHVVLVNPSDMGNLGTIARTLLGFEFRDLALIRPAADVFDPRAVRASMGAIFGLRCAYFERFEEYQAAFERPLYPFMTTAATPLDAVTFSQPCALIFGNESSGLPGAFAALGRPVIIPHGGEIDSLNLSVAVGIALYGVTRRTGEQRGGEIA